MTAMSGRVRQKFGAKRADGVARTVLRGRSLLGHRGYRRFLVVGIARTGSTLLVNLLNAHPQVMAFGELFRQADEVGWDVAPFASYRSPRLVALYRADPVAFLEKAVFRRWPRDCAAVGFKLFYYHAREAPQSAVWTYLCGDLSLKVLHIKRRNRLAQYLSLLHAHKSDVWSAAEAAAGEPAPLHLDPESCRAHFASVRQHEEDCAEAFKQHTIRDVYFEDLTSNCEQEFSAIQEVLGLKHEVIKPTLKRQRRRPLSQAVANFDELKAAFRGSCWEDIFDDAADLGAVPATAMRQ